jgi:hypothetical protein
MNEIQQHLAQIPYRRQQADLAEEPLRSLLHAALNDAEFRLNQAAEQEETVK